MFHMTARSVGWVAVLSLLSSAFAWADLPPTWVWPTYTVEAPKEKRLTVTQTVHYSEQSYVRPVEIVPIARNEQRYSTPEEALVSRMSAIKAGDFDWWLSTWDSASKAMVQAKNKAEGKDPAYWALWWREQYANAKFIITRKVETGDYVVLIYKAIGKSAPPTAEGVELPVILKKVKDQWFTTLDLRADPLPIASPWVSGRSEDRSSMY